MIILSFRLENYRTWQMAPKEIKGEFSNNHKMQKGQLDYNIN